MAPIRHEWYQSDTEVVLNIFAKNVTADQASIEFGPDQLSVDINVADSSVQFNFSPLYSEVVPEKCSYRIIPAKIEIKLSKRTAGLKWPSLEGAAAAPAPPKGRPAQKNWDKLLETEDDTKDDETDAFFKKIYADATDEQRRAMMKSFQESNGTALSTDWSSVSKERVPTQPPEGMVAKKWNE